MNGNMNTNKAVCKIQQYILYFTFSSLEPIDTVLVTFVDIIFVIFFGMVFVTFIYMLSVAFTISLHTITRASAICFKY